MAKIIRREYEVWDKFTLISAIIFVICVGGIFIVSELLRGWSIC